MLVDIEARADDLLELRTKIEPQRFATIDPDADGAALLFSVHPDREAAREPTRVFFNLRTNPIEIAGCAIADGIRLFVVEAQYVGFNRMTPIRLARRAMVIPAIACGMRVGTGYDPTVTVLNLPPATWQAHVRRGFGAHVKREDGKQYVLDYAERRAPSMFKAEWSKSARVTVADAFGMSEWVRDVLWGNKGARTKF